MKKQYDNKGKTDQGDGRVVDPEAGAPDQKIDTHKFEDMHFFITSPACWIYMHIILMLSQVLRVGEAWFYSCPCHSNPALSSAAHTSAGYID